MAGYLKVASANGVEGNSGGKDCKERSEKSLDDRLVLAPTIVLSLPESWFGLIPADISLPVNHRVSQLEEHIYRGLEDEVHLDQI